VEVGPGSVLTKLAEAILGEGAENAAEAFALDASGGSTDVRGQWGVLDLGGTLARLAARGHPVRLTAWEEGSRCRPAAARPGLTVPLTGANYVSPRAKRPPRPAPMNGSPTPGVRPNPAGPAKVPAMSDAAN